MNKCNICNDNYGNKYIIHCKYSVWKEGKPKINRYICAVCNNKIREFYKMMENLAGDDAYIDISNTVLFEPKENELK